MSEPPVDSFATAESPITSARRFVRALRNDRSASFALILTFAWVFLSLAGPVLIGGDPNEQDLASTQLPPIWLEGGTRQFPLGTDQLGRDILLRIVYGAQSSLMLGFFSVGLAAVVGCLAGVVAAEWGGLVDEAVMRIADVQLSIPFILLAITILTLLGGSVINMILVLVLAGWVGYARVVRSELLHLRELDFVLAARAAGASRTRIAYRHLLPNTMGLIIVLATLQLADVILLSAALSFLGVGLQAPAVSWGAMLADGRDYLTTAWWISTMPGIAITLVILAVNMVGDWLRDLFDPHSRRK